MSTQAIATLLRTRVGLELASLGDASLANTLAERMRKTGESSAASYFGLLLADEREFAALCAEICVPESWFFRDSLQIAGFVQFCREFRSARPGQSLRVLSIPCAAGEEAYTLSIALLEAGWQPNEYSVLGVELNESYIERARAGEFGAWSLRGRVPGARFLEGIGERWRVTPWAKSSVSFRTGNVVDPHAFGDFERFDVIFNRNLLIYLTDAAKRTWLQTLHRIIDSEGLIVTGHAESLSTLDPAFTPRPELGPNCFSRGPAPAKLTTANLVAFVKPSVPVRSAAATAAVITQQQLAIPSPPQPISALASVLQQIRELADNGELERAAAVTQQAMASHGEHAELLYLSGVVASARGQVSQARDQLERALYLDRDHSEALSMLALIAERGGQLEQARRYRARLKRVQLRGPANARG